MLVFRLPPLEQRHSVPAAIGRLIDFFMALVAYEYKVIQIVEPLLWGLLVPPGAIAAEGVDVRLLGDVNLLLGDRGLPERFVASVELTPSRSLPPEHPLHGILDVPGHLAWRTGRLSLCGSRAGILRLSTPFRKAHRLSFIASSVN